MEMMRAVLDTNFWLATHVVVVTFGYASTFVAGTLATAALTASAPIVVDVALRFGPAEYFALAVLVFVSAFTPLTLRHAGAAEDPFYAGKTLTIIAGFAPGGTIDIRARLFGRHLPKYLPGSPSVVVQNMVGAGGLVAAKARSRR